MLDLKYYELCRLERRKADENVHDAMVHVALPRRFGVALYKVCFSRRSTLEGTLAEEVLHEGPDIEANLLPERFVIRFEYDPLRAAVEGFFYEQGQSAHRDVFPLGTNLIIAA